MGSVVVPTAISPGRPYRQWGLFRSIYQSRGGPDQGRPPGSFRNPRYTRPRVFSKCAYRDARGNRYQRERRPSLRAGGSR